MNTIITADWRTLPAGGALDAIIATTLGLNVVTRAELKAMKGVYIRQGRSWAQSWIIDAQAAEELYPYSTNTDRALTLVKDMEISLRAFQIVKDPWVWECSLPDMRTCLTDSPLSHVDHVHGYGDTPAMAICKAWLALQDTQKGTVQS